MIMCRPTFYRIWKRGAVESFSPLPYLAAVMNCMLWIFYGLPFVHPNSTLVVTINAVGLFLEIVYLSIFFIFATKKQRLYVLKFLAGEVLLMILIVALVLSLAHTTKLRTFVAGIFAAIFNVYMYGSPLSIMRMVIQTKSVKYMPVYLSFFNFLNGCCWMAYALIIIDFFIAIPNGLGALLGLIQLILYACYYRSTVWDEDDKKPKAEVQLPGTTSAVAPGGGAPEFHSITFSSR
ncbi:hypothetical protein ACLOJK_001442 [Asimina triloba]